MKDGMSIKAKIFTPCVFVSLYIPLNTDNSKGFQRFRRRIFTETFSQNKNAQILCKYTDCA